MLLMETASNQLLFASADNGLARYNWNSGFWLATWNDANWLPSNKVSGIKANQDTLHIMGGDQLLSYNLTTGVFASSVALDDVGLVESDYNALFAWSPGGQRAPSTRCMLQRMVVALSSLKPRCRALLVAKLFSQADLQSSVNRCT